MSGHFEGFSFVLGCDSNFLCRSALAGRRFYIPSSLRREFSHTRAIVQYGSTVLRASNATERPRSAPSSFTYVPFDRFAFHVDLLLSLPPFRPTREEGTRLLSNLRVYSCSSGRTYEERSNEEPIAGQQEDEEKIMGCCRRRRAPPLAPRRPRDDFVVGGGDSSRVCRSLPPVSAFFIV
jgi:hypothetical protein